MKFNKFKLKDRIKKLLEVEKTEIIENSIHNEDTLKKELKKIVKHHEEKIREKPIDTSILIKKVEKKDPRDKSLRTQVQPEPVAPVQQGTGIREKKFKCECGSAFARKHDLTRHQWKTDKHIKWVHDNKQSDK
jgi:hypothetical protein